jgi:hypothetical protein
MKQHSDWFSEGKGGTQRAKMPQWAPEHLVRRPFPFIEPQEARRESQDWSRQSTPRGQQWASKSLSDQRWRDLSLRGRDVGRLF